MNANYLLNAVATGDKEEVKSAFETLIQDRVTDALEVRKVELASTIFGVQEEEINEAAGYPRKDQGGYVGPNPKHTHQVTYTVPGEGRSKQYFQVTADDDDHAREQLKDAQPTAKIHSVQHLKKGYLRPQPSNEEVVQEGEGMDAQRRWTRHVSAIGKGYEGSKGHKVSLNRTGLKAAARSYFQRYGGVKGHGAEFVDRGARFVRDARKEVKASKLTDEETIVEGGPTRKHFQQTADLIKQIEHPEKRKEMAAHHASLFAQQNPRFDKKKFYAAAGVNEETVSEVIEAGAPSPRNVITNIRRGIAALRIKGVNPAIASRAHADYSKLVSKNPKAPGYMLLRKLAPNKAAAMQALTQAGLPVGGALDANPTEYNQALQRVKRFK
jgi:hypothetical protein